MAKRTILIDDLDGTEGVDTRRFSIGANFYEVDLSTENYNELLSMLKPYITAGRHVRGPRVRKQPEPKTVSASSGLSREQRVAIRNWARDHGYEIADRGAFSREVLDAYAARERE